mmetsp:Transcript_3215/g.8235  ORF Transcript_3215/g.8235 Transcript_3215/m.8235 type:complete len:174 (+) Transcript_3215:649-1170(+)
MLSDAVVSATAVSMDLPPPLGLPINDHTLRFGLGDKSLSIDGTDTLAGCGPTRNPYGQGQFANHPPLISSTFLPWQRAASAPNCCFVSLALPELTDEHAALLTNEPNPDPSHDAARHPTHPTRPTAVAALVALRDIEDEEVFVDYGLDPLMRLRNSWYGVPPPLPTVHPRPDR